MKIVAREIAPPVMLVFAPLLMMLHLQRRFARYGKKFSQIGQHVSHILRRVVAGLLAALPGMGSIVFLIGLIYYVFAIMATKLFGDDNPNLFGTLGDSLFTLFTVMTLEGWTNDVAKPVMQNHPYAWVFFVVYIVITTFMVLNLFIGVVVNAMQEEASKEIAGEREVEREIIQEEAAPILAEVKSLRTEVAELRDELAGRRAKTGG